MWKLVWAILKEYHGPNLCCQSILCLCWNVESIAVSTLHCDTGLVEPKVRENLCILWISKSWDWVRAELWLDWGKRQEMKCKWAKWMQELCKSHPRVVRAIRSQDQWIQEEGDPEGPGQGVRIKWSEECYTSGNPCTREGHLSRL